MKDTPIGIVSVSHHRNGISGTPFAVVLFDHEGTRKVGIVFTDSKTDNTRDASYDGCTAVLDVALLAAGDIGFGHNSWRGDYFESDLLAAIREYDARRAQELRDLIATLKVMT